MLILADFDNHPQTKDINPTLRNKLNNISIFSNIGKSFKVRYTKGSHNHTSLVVK